MRSLGDSGWWHVDAIMAPEIDFAILLVCNQGGVDQNPAGAACTQAAAVLRAAFAPAITR